MRRFLRVRHAMSKHWTDTLRDTLHGVLCDGENPPEPEDWVEAARALKALCLQEARVACEACRGSGERMYGHGSTWRGGMGVSVCTPDVCDACWGSGDRTKPGVDLRSLTDQIQHEKRNASERWLLHRLGSQSAVGYFPRITEKLKRVRWAGGDFWFQRVIDALVDVLEDFVEAGQAKDDPASGAE